MEILGLLGLKPPSELVATRELRLDLTKRHFPTWAKAETGHCPGKYRGLRNEIESGRMFLIALLTGKKWKIK